MSSIDNWSDSGSLTPPLPAIEESWKEQHEIFDEDLHEVRFKRRKTEEGDERKLALLFNNCGQCRVWKHGETSPVLSAGYIKNGYLTRLLQNEDPKHNLFEKPVVTLFGYKFLCSSALVECKQKLFYLLRQTITEFESKQVENGVSQFSQVNISENSWYFIDIRRQCTCFLLYIISFLHRTKLSLLATPGEPENVDPYIQMWNSFSLSLKMDIDNLWVFFGPINTLPNSVFLKLDTVGGSSTSTTQLTPASHWLHLNLEMKLAMLEVLTRLYHSYELKSIDHLTEIEEKSQSVLIDLIQISTHINFRTKTGNDVVKVSPFLCHCVQEMWVVMIHLLDTHAEKYGIQSFWTIVTNILNHGILQRDPNGNRTELSCDVAQLRCKDPVKFCWWLVVHVSDLYWYDENGHYTLKENANVPGNWVLVLDLLKLSFQFKERKIEEDTSRCYLTSCLHICQHWHPNNDVILLLWDYFQKKMNDTYHIAGQGLQHLACARDMPYQWFEKMLERCSHPLLSNEHENSFHLFLRIVALHLKRLKVTKPTQGWKQLKGRFYSKFHKKRMEELSEQGLNNFFNLFLTLAHLGELEDAANKMLAFLDLLDLKALENNKKYCIWKGYFVLLFLYKYEGTSMDYVAQKVSKIFSEICRDYQDAYKDKTLRHSAWNLVSIYLECTQELMEYKNQESQDDYKLIGDGFGILFPISGEKELQALVSFTQSLLVVVSNELQVQSAFQSALAQSLWQYIFPHIHQRCTDPVNCQMPGFNHMTNLLVSFTLLAIQHPPTGSPDSAFRTFHDLVRQFGANDSIPASVSCKFLGFLLLSPHAVELVQGCDYQADLIHTWFRCCIMITPQEKSLQDLTRAVFLKFPEINNIIKVQKSIVAGNVETALMTFIRSLGETFSSLELLTDMVAFREKALVYFGDVLKYMEGFLKQAGPLERLRSVHL